MMWEKARLSELEAEKNYALRLLGRREYSVFELEEKIRKKFSRNEADIAVLLRFLREKKWLSDERFCEAFIRDQIRTYQGPKKIAVKLKRKGISSSLIKKSLEKFYSYRTQNDLIRYLGEKKQKSLKQKNASMSDFERKGRITRFLLGRGFDYDAIINYTEEIGEK